jgi:hypothetical protein
LIHFSLLSMLIFFAVVTVLAGLRVGASLRGRRQSYRLMPPANQLSWRATNLGANHTIQSGTKSIVVATKETVPFQAVVSSTQGDPEEPLFWTPVTGAAFADGLLAGLPVVQAVSHIDPFVLKAIESSTADHIHSFPSVHSYVEQHFFAAPTLTADGWFERLTGYVAEQKAASALEAAGHHVTFAATANQPVWDMLVDGHPAQIKEGLTGVKAFLLEHHGIPIYTGYEAAAAAKDPMVHGLVGLNSVEIHDSAHASIEGVSDTFDPGFHFPIITLAFAGYREAKLLFHERTTFNRALKHVSLDVAGVGVGAFGGAKAGAFAGAFLGPIGAAIGGLLGAVAGGVGGKLISTKIRHAPFQNSRVAYDQAVESAQLSIDAEVLRSRDEILNLQRTFESEFNECRMQIIHRATSQIRACSDTYEKTFMDFAERFTIHLDELTSNLLEQETLLLAAIPGTGFIGIFFPSDNDHLRSAIRLWFKRTRKLVSKEKSSFQKLEPRTIDTLRAEIDRFLQTYIFELESLDAQLMNLVTEFSKSQEKAKRIEESAVSEVQQERDNLIKLFARQAENLHLSLVELIKQCNTRVSERRDTLVREARAVGIDL